MPDVRPFRSWRYDPAVAGPLATLICPPYDVVPPARAEDLMARNAHNAIRLELGPGALDPAASDNRYARAAGTLDAWVRAGALRRDAEPFLYVYEQRFIVDGQERRRFAFFAAVRLAPWDAGEVLPHERTLSAPKRDRLALLEATRANISPIYALCDAGLPGVDALRDAAARRAPDVEAIDDEGVAHRLWLVRDPAVLAGVTAALADHPLYIADGHHRYETALAYAEARERLDRAGPDGVGYVLMALTPVDDPGLVVFPTHRLAHDLDSARVAYGLTRLHESFEVEIVEGVPPAGRLLARMAEAVETGAHAFGLYTSGLTRLLRPRPTPPQIAGLDPALQGLDVALLQALLFEDVLGLTAEDVRGQRYVDYTRDADEALRRVDEGSCQLAVLLNPTPARAVLDVARAGTRMPQKSTYFYPKLATGLVLRRLEP